MGGRNSWGAVLAGLTVLGGLGFWTFRPAVIPNVTVVSEGEALTLDQVRGDKRKLVLALIHPSDPNSKAAVATLKAQFPTWETRATFAGLVLADPASAAAFQKENELPFTVYAFTPQEHPEAYNELVKAVGGFRNRFFVGTVLVLDQSRRISQQVNGDELEKLPATLTRL